MKMKNIKRVLSLLLSILILSTTMLTISASAAEYATSGTCGENLTWKLDKKGTLRISGTGDMDNYSYEMNGFINPLGADKPIKALVIEEGVTSIGSGAFFNCPTLTSVKIADSVTNIGNQAFYECTGLTSIVIPKGVTHIGKRVFSACDNLNTIIVDKKNRIYDSRNNCNAIIETKTDTLVAACNSTVIPDDIKIVGEYAFEFRGFENIIIPTGVTKIGDYAFSGCKKLKNINIPDTVKYIGRDAFSCCHSLYEIKIPNGITEIRKCTFSGCTNLLDVTIPDSVKYIGARAFTYCESLEYIKIPEGVTVIDDGAFACDRHLLWITIPETVERIGEEAFLACGLESIYLPASVTEVGRDALNYVDIYYGGDESSKPDIFIECRYNKLDITWHYNHKHDMTRVICECGCSSVNLNDDDYYEDDFNDHIFDRFVSNIMDMFERVWSFIVGMFSFSFFK